MKTREQLVNEHIQGFESRQHHIEELLDRARLHAEKIPVLKEDLIKIETRHDDLMCNLKEMKQGRFDEKAIQDIENAGPMGVWYGLVDELETLIERTEH